MRHGRVLRRLRNSNNNKVTKHDLEMGSRHGFEDGDGDPGVADGGEEETVSAASGSEGQCKITVLALVVAMIIEVGIVVAIVAIWLTFFGLRYCGDGEELIVTQSTDTGMMRFHCSPVGVIAHDRDVAQPCSSTTTSVSCTSTPSPSTSPCSVSPTKSRSSSPQSLSATVTLSMTVSFSSSPTVELDAEPDPVTPSASPTSSISLTSSASSAASDTASASASLSASRSATPSRTPSRSATVSVSPTPVTEFFILGGQSNMFYGWPIESSIDSVTSDRVMVLNGDGSLSPASDPLQFPDNTHGVSWGMEFARRYAAANPHVTVVLVPVAYGGSGFSATNPAFSWRARWGELYNNTVTRVNIGLAAVEGSRVGGLLWAQGEADVGQPGMQAQFLEMVAALKQDIPQTSGMRILVRELLRDFITFNGANGLITQHIHENLPADLELLAFCPSTPLAWWSGDFLYYSTPLHFNSNATRTDSGAAFDTCLARADANVDGSTLVAPAGVVVETVGVTGFDVRIRAGNCRADDFRLEVCTGAGYTSCAAAGTHGSPTLTLFYQLRGLLAGTAYAVRVYTRFGDDESTAYAEALVTTLSIASGGPSACATVSLEAGAHYPTKIYVEWTAPASGVTPTHYRPEHRAFAPGYPLLANATWIPHATVTAGTLSAYLTGLAPAQSYLVRIVPIASGIDGDSGFPSTGFTNGSPGPVTNLRATSANTTAIWLAWTLPRRGGPTWLAAPPAAVWVTENNAYYRIQGDPDWLLLGTLAGGTTSSVAVTLLTPGTTYEFYVQPSNSRGSGDPGSVLVASTIALPSASASPSYSASTGQTPTASPSFSATVSESSSRSFTASPSETPYPFDTNLLAHWTFNDQSLADTGPDELYPLSSSGGWTPAYINSGGSYAAIIGEESNNGALQAAITVPILVTITLNYRPTWDEAYDQLWGAGPQRSLGSYHNGLRLSDPFYSVWPCGPDMVTDTWTHISTVWVSAHEIWCYRDGVFVYQTTGDIDVTLTGSTFVIGNIQGWFDDIRIYGFSMSEAEIGLVFEKDAKTADTSVSVTPSPSRTPVSASPTQSPVSVTPTQTPGTLSTTPTLSPVSVTPSRSLSPTPSTSPIDIDSNLLVRYTFNSQTLADSAPGGAHPLSATGGWVESYIDSGGSYAALIGSASSGGSLTATVTVPILMTISLNFRPTDPLGYDRIWTVGYRYLESYQNILRLRDDSYPVWPVCATMQTGKWLHVTVVYYSNTRSHQYCDGVLHDEATGDVVNTDGGTEVVLGNLYGYFDDIRIYTSVLSADAVLAVFNADAKIQDTSSITPTPSKSPVSATPSPVPQDLDAGLLAYYTFDDSTLDDTSPGGTHPLIAVDGYSETYTSSGGSMALEISAESNGGRLNTDIVIPETGSITLNFNLGEDGQYSAIWDVSTRRLEAYMQDPRLSDAATVWGFDPDLVTGQWVWIGVSFVDSATEKVYVNGVLVMTAGNGTPVSGASSFFRLGFMLGLYDDIRLYDYPLNGPQMLLVYTADAKS